MVDSNKYKWFDWLIERVILNEKRLELLFHDELCCNKLRKRWHMFCSVEIFETFIITLFCAGTRLNIERKTSKETFGFFLLALFYYYTTTRHLFLKMHLEMDASYCALPSSSIFQELQRIHDTGFFSPVHSLEDKFQQVNVLL